MVIDFFTALLTQYTARYYPQCETYDFGLELEATLVKAFGEVSISFTPQVITGEFIDMFYLQWDSMNKITNINGLNVVNSAGGIMIQEVKPGFDATNQDLTLPRYKRRKTRSLKVDTPKILAPVHIFI